MRIYRHPPLLSFLFAPMALFLQGVFIATEEPSKEQLRAHILQKLSRQSRWGAKHTALIHVRSALPKKYRQYAEELAKELANEGFITWLKKTGEIHVSLNSHRSKDIAAIIEKYRDRPVR